MFSLRNYISNGMISAGVLDRKIVLPDVCPGLSLGGAGAQGSLFICSLHWFSLLPAVSSPHFAQLGSLFSSPHFLFFNALLQKLLQSTCQPQQPLLRVTPSDLGSVQTPSFSGSFFCPEFLWFSIFPSIHFLNSGFCYLWSTLNISAVFLLSITLVIWPFHSHLVSHRLLWRIFFLL